jgi:hypothetical protein
MMSDEEKNEDKKLDTDVQELRKSAAALKPTYPETTFKAFLEGTPPDTYVHVTDLRLANNDRYLETPDIEMFCESSSCSGLRIFRAGEILGQTSWRNEFLRYTCRNCGTRNYIFAIAFLLEVWPTTTSPGRAKCLKYGQQPSFGPPTPTRLISLIGEDREIFLQGRRAENRGMGIGAFAYYRRVVENQKNRLIAEIAKVSQVVGSTPEVDALFERAMKETRFSESIDMVKSVIPQTLLIRGQNPLTLLHSALSKGLHDPDMTDARCLALAQSIRTILAELAERISEALKSDKEIQSALSVLMAAPATPAKRGTTLP